MFVIVQSWHNFAAPMGKAATLASRFGATMRHAGVAITVTSVTDVVAFAVGSTTVS